MKYIYLNLIAFSGFALTYSAFKYGYFSNINNFVNTFPRINFLTWLFFIVTDLGSILFITIGSMFLISTLVVRGWYHKAIYTITALLGGLSSQTIIKNYLEIHRPENSVVSSFGYSFPSGHANMITILLLCSILYLFSSVVNSYRKNVYYFISISLILLVGLSRLYLNAHWVSDVVAGWFFGLFWATAPLAFYGFKKHFTAR